MGKRFEGLPQESSNVPEERSGKVKEIVAWLDSKRVWPSGDPLPEYAEDAPDVSESDLQSMLLEMKPDGVVGMEQYDIRGYFITALADRINEQAFSKWREEHPNASDNEINQWWDTEAKIELTHPDTGKYSWERFLHMGYGWERGTLVLRGDFGDGTAGAMKGGKVIVEGNTGPRAGAIMSGGQLEINGTASYDLGYGMTGGNIHARKSAPSPGALMHGGTIEIDEIDLTLRGSNNAKIDRPDIGNGKTGGRIVVGGKEF